MTPCRNRSASKSKQSLRDLKVRHIRICDTFTVMLTQCLPGEFMDITVVLLFDIQDDGWDMYRSFYCTKCSHSWVSGQAWDNVQQRCWRCNTMVMPQEPTQKQYWRSNTMVMPQELTMQLHCNVYNFYFSNCAIHYHSNPRANSDEQNGHASSADPAAAL